MVIEAWASQQRCDATPTTELHQNKALRACTPKTLNTNRRAVTREWFLAAFYRLQKSEPNDTLNRAITKFYDRRHDLKLWRKNYLIFLIFMCRRPRIEQIFWIACAYLIYNWVNSMTQSMIDARVIILEPCVCLGDEDLDHCACASWIRSFINRLMNWDWLSAWSKSWKCCFMHPYCTIFCSHLGFIIET